MNINKHRILDNLKYMEVLILTNINQYIAYLNIRETYGLPTYESEYRAIETVKHFMKQLYSDKIKINDYIELIQDLYALKYFSTEESLEKQGVNISWEDLDIKQKNIINKNRSHLEFDKILKNIGCDSELDYSEAYWQYEQLKQTELNWSKIKDRMVQALNWK